MSLKLGSWISECRKMDRDIDIHIAEYLKWEKRLHSLSKNNSLSRERVYMKMEELLGLIENTYREIRRREELLIKQGGIEPLILLYFYYKGYKDDEIGIRFNLSDRQVRRIRKESVKSLEEKIVA